MGLDTLGRFLAICYKGDKFCDFLFALLYTKTSENRFTLQVVDSTTVCN